MWTPSIREFLRSKQPIPISRKRPLKNLDPLKIFQALDETPPSCLLESVKGPDRISRFSFIAVTPYLILEAKGPLIKLTEGSRTLYRVGNPVAFLSELMARFYVNRPSGLPPFFGGAVGYFGYDLIHSFEDLPRRAVDDLQVPDLFLAFFDTVVAIDHVERMLYLIFCPTPERFFKSDRARLYDDAKKTLDHLESKILLSFPHESHIDLLNKQPNLSALQANLAQEEYIKRVNQCQRYISQGDIFQANLSVRFSVFLDSYNPLGLYTLLRAVNPAPFAAFLDLGRFQLLSSSPERLVRVSGKLVETRPIAGTRPRGKNTVQDQQFKADLLTSCKEQAEHLMLVDLERNDLGKVCQYGSIKVDELMITEQYSHVMHIVSNIQGRLNENVSSLDVLQAVFPGGTITGVPKIRCMQIIDELEPTARGPYTGSVGYLSFAGDMDLNIFIRSFLMMQRTAYFQVGAGIVADSDPQMEYQECLYKAEALLKALRMASIRIADEGCVGHGKNSGTMDLP